MACSKAACRRGNDITVVAATACGLEVVHFKGLHASPSLAPHTVLPAPYTASTGTVYHRRSGCNMLGYAHAWAYGFSEGRIQFCRLGFVLILP